MYLLCILWKDDFVADALEGMTPTDDEESMLRLKKAQGTEIDLPMLFDLYHESENLDEFCCPTCKGKGAKNTAKFWRYPDVLVLQLKRFDWEAGRKITVPVKLTESIDLRPWLTDGAEDDGRETRFDLFGIVNHFGSMRGGHYTASCRRPNGWYEFDDQRVRPGSWDHTTYTAAYVLFFRRRGLAPPPKK